MRTWMLCFVVMLSAGCLAPLVAGCGSGTVTSPTGPTLAGTVWSGPFADSRLGTGTMTLNFGRDEDAAGRWWSLSMADGAVLGPLRVLPRSMTDPANAVTLGLATAALNPDCDMLLNARVNGAQMQGTLRIGRCEPQGQRVAEVRLIRRTALVTERANLDSSASTSDCYPMELRSGAAALLLQ